MYNYLGIIKSVSKLESVDKKTKVRIMSKGLLTELLNIWRLPIWLILFIVNCLMGIIMWISENIIEIIAQVTYCGCDKVRDTYLINLNTMEEVDIIVNAIKKEQHKNYKVK